MVYVHGVWMTSQVFIFCCFVYRQLYGTFQRLFPESKRWLVRSTSKSMETFASQRGPGTRESWRTSWASPLDVLRKPKKMPKTVKPQFFWIIFADYFQVFRFFRNVFWGWNSSAVRTSGSRLSHSAVPAPSLLKRQGVTLKFCDVICCLKMCTLQALQSWKYQAFGDGMIDFRKNWHDIFVFSYLFLVKYEIIQSIHHLNPKLLGTWVCLLELVLSSCLCWLVVSLWSNLQFICSGHHLAYLKIGYPKCHGQCLSSFSSDPGAFHVGREWST